jgi:polyhydroxybutyrate depolymerase
MKYFSTTFIGATVICCSTTAFCETRVSVTTDRGEVAVYIPDSYNKSKPLPLLVALHGFTSNSDVIERYWGFTKLVDEKQFLLCIPNGTKNSKGKQFWNATEACCDLEKVGVDDSSYLLSLVEQIESEYAVDPQSIHFYGHSNGGFMSFRMACDHADKIASIASLAGAMHDDGEGVSPSESVHVLHVHGTEDRTIKYDGGCWDYGCYPSARKSVEVWAGFNKCDKVPVQSGTADFVGNVAGDDTTVLRYEPNGVERTGATAELWTIHGAGHAPSFNATFGPRVVDWLLSHRKTVQEETVLPRADNE